MKRELTEKLLKSFQRFDPYRHTLDYFMPITFNSKNYCVATSAHHFIMIPETEENKIEPPTEKVVNFAAILKPFDLNIEFMVKTLVDAYDSIPLITRDEMEDCPSCDGEGEFEHYGHTYECEYCLGKGELSTGRKETVKDPDARLVIDENSFKPEFVKDIIGAIKETDCQKIAIRYQSDITILELDDSILCGLIICMVTSDDKPILVV